MKELNVTKKASEVVAESLKVIAGEECDKLWETLVSSRSMKQHFSLASSGTEDVDLALLESGRMLQERYSGTRVVRYCP